MAPGVTPADIARAGSLIVIDPNGHRVRVEIQPVPFRIGRQVDNHLILRDTEANLIVDYMLNAIR